ncbi:MAG: extracellular solute-binding protein [Chloroflexota bacterium]|nr:extracellular solute-binding protein [Chloroflexota bacterium]
MDQSQLPLRRWLALAAVIAMVAVACAGPGASPSPTGALQTPFPTEAPAETGSPAGTPGETPAGTPGETPAETGSPAASPTFANIGGTVSVMASWTGSEEDSFRAMIEPWVQQTGVQVNYVGTREMQQQLTAAIQAGGTGLPDVAGIPGPGLALDWYEAGALKPLDFIDLEAYRASAPPGMADLGVAEDGTLIGIFTKAAVKGLIWYNVGVYDGTVPGSWEELQGTDPQPAGALWCNALESGGASGWPGTDWIEDFVVRDAGPEAYDQWVRGELAWTSPEIRAAFERWIEVVNTSAGGGAQINATNFGEVGDGLFTDPADCKFVHQASFISDFFVNNSGATPEQFDFFVMPGEALTGGGDMFGMFNDTEQARSLMQYLITPQAQQIWAERGGFIAANINVPTDVYASESDRKAAAALQEASAFRFDGSDMMPGEMNDAFFRAMVEVTANPGNLDSILQGLDEVQSRAYAGGGASPSP